MDPTDNYGIARLEHAIGLCRRLLKQNEDLLEHIDVLYAKLRWLGEQYREVRAERDQADSNHAVASETADILLAADPDELGTRRTG